MVNNMKWSKILLKLDQLLNILSLFNFYMIKQNEYSKCKHYLILSLLIYFINLFLLYF